MPDHKCRGQMYSLEVIASEEDEDCVLTEQGMVCTVGSEEELVPWIPLNALTCVNNYQTMRVRGCMGKHVLHILIDSWSTHNFLHLYTAKRLGCKKKKICPLQVSMANGQVMSSM